ncbi:MAG TPA: AraC family transcriptional regulator [Verrucomicrobiae bacterium]
MMNCWGTVSLNGFVMLTAMLRSRADGRAAPPPGNNGSSAATFHPDSVSIGLRPPPAQTLAVTVFEHAGNLLRLLLHDLQQTTLATCARLQMERADRLLHHHQVEEARLRRELASRLPWLGEPPATTNVESRGAMAVRRLLEHLQHHYTEAAHLKGFAASVGMNASYLSDLFSRMTGLRFQDYLSELRLAKAKDLLADPLRPIKEVARRVGYPDSNSFRQAFKSKTGLAPAVWRTSV